MRLSFPLELSVGTDIIHCKRILDWNAPERFKGERFLSTFLHQKDFRQLEKRFPWWKEPLEDFHWPKRRSLSLWLSGRWAAKEAAKKAWRADLLSFKDLVVESSAKGNAPEIVCSLGWKDPIPEASGAKPTVDQKVEHHQGHSRHLMNRITEQVARVSISHDGEYATATVIATPLHPDIVAELEKRKAEAERKVNNTPEKPK